MKLALCASLLGLFVVTHGASTSPSLAPTLSQFRAADDTNITSVRRELPHYKDYDYDYKLKECEYDCDKDEDCAYGLLCADEHKRELKHYGYDPRKAYCYPHDKPGKGFNSHRRRYKEVCYDPYKIYHY